MVVYFYACSIEDRAKVKKVQLEDARILRIATGTKFLRLIFSFPLQSLSMFISNGADGSTYQRILALAGNITFKNIEMESIWKNVQSKIKSIITYSGEPWNLNKGQAKELNGIMDKILKRIFKVPVATLEEALYIEIGLLDPTTIIKRNRIYMETGLKSTGNKQLKEVVKNNQKDEWKQTTQLIKEEIGITNEDIEKSTYKSKRKVRKKTIEYFKKTIENEGKERKPEWKPGKRPEYMHKRIRNQVSINVQATTRMIKVKENYRKGQRYLIILCRVYRTEVETQQHILEECVELHEDGTTKVTKNDIFKEDVYHLKEIANTFQKTMDKLTQFKA